MAHPPKLLQEINIYCHIINVTKLPKTMSKQDKKRDRICNSIIFLLFIMSYGRASSIWNLKYNAPPPPPPSFFNLNINFLFF